MFDMGAETPEVAAMGDIPPEFCSVIAKRELGDIAYVLLNTGTDVKPYPYGVVCSWNGDSWDELCGSNGGGWSSMPQNPDLGVVASWDEAPQGVDAVRVRYLEEEHEIAIENGFFLFVAIQAPPDAGPDWVTARVDGRWVPYPQLSPWGSRLWTSGDLP